MSQRPVLDYENPQAREPRSIPTEPPLSKAVLYRIGVVIGVIFAWWALVTSQDLSDPFVAGDRVYFDHAYLFLPLLALVAAIAFESRSYIMRNASSNAIKSRMAGPIIAALFLPTAYCALIEGGTAVGGDVRFACQTPSLCVAGFWSVSIAIVVAAGFFAPAPMKADDRWFLVGWAAPNVFVINFEGFKYLGQSIMRSPGGVDEYALGGIFYWFLASMIGLLAVPLFVALFFEPEPREQQSSMNEACAACGGDGV